MGGTVEVDGFGSWLGVKAKEWLGFLADEVLGRGFVVALGSVGDVGGFGSWRLCGGRGDDGG